jgi:hypothetical protein
VSKRRDCKKEREFVCVCVCVCVFCRIVKGETKCMVVLFIEVKDTFSYIIEKEGRSHRHHLLICPWVSQCYFLITLCTNLFTRNLLTTFVLFCFFVFRYSSFNK